jgi:hypothetical protein
MLREHIGLIQIRVLTDFDEEPVLEELFDCPVNLRSILNRPEALIVTMTGTEIEKVIHLYGDK